MVESVSMSIDYKERYSVILLPKIREYINNRECLHKKDVNNKYFVKSTKSTLSYDMFPGFTDVNIFVDNEGKMLPFEEQFLNELIYEFGNGKEIETHRKIYTDYETYAVEGNHYITANGKILEMDFKCSSKILSMVDEYNKKNNKKLILEKR